MNVFVADIGGTTIKTGLFHNGNIHSVREHQTESHFGGEYIIEKLIQLIKEYGKVEAIGISTAGQVDSEQGKILFANNNIPNYTGMHIRKILQEQFQLPVQVENDANAAALGELHYGIGKMLHNFICITYGTGIGGAIIQNKKLYKGISGVAGEFGQILIQINDTSEHIEYKNYEELASTTALINMAKLIDGNCKNGKYFFNQYSKGDVRFNMIFKEWISNIVTGMVSIIHVLNPEAIVIGGGIMEQSLIIEKIKGEIFNKLSPSFSNVEILKASLGNNAGMYGVGSLFLKNS